MKSIVSGVRLVIAITVLVGCIGCDQASKSIATRTLRDAQPQSFLGDTVRLHYAENPGGFLSVGGSLASNFRTIIFIGFNACMMIAVSGVLIFNRRLTMAMFLCLLLILAGGIGNLIDRVTNDGLVIDFINMGIGPVRTGIFNVADIAVMCGAAIAVWLSTERTPDGMQAENPEPQP